MYADSLMICTPDAVQANEVPRGQDHVRKSGSVGQRVAKQHEGGVRGIGRGTSTRAGVHGLVSDVHLSHIRAAAEESTKEEEGTREKMKSIFADKNEVLVAASIKLLRAGR